MSGRIYGSTHGEYVSTLKILGDNGVAAIVAHGNNWSNYKLESNLADLKGKRGFLWAKILGDHGGSIELAAALWEDYLE